jgi:hypothetical protein
MLKLEYITKEQQKELTNQSIILNMMIPKYRALSSFYFALKNGGVIYAYIKET